MVDPSPSSSDEHASATDDVGAIADGAPSERQSSHRVSSDSRNGPLADTTSAKESGETVSLEALTKQYDDEIAVDSISLDVEEGELLVLLGPSGCGKTTTLRMIAGLESVTDGSVAIGGTDVSTSAPQKRDVAMVFQNYALYPHKTVRENIRFPLRKTELPKDGQEDRIDATAELLDIADLLEKEPAALSGGQRQRVAIGRAIAREPSVLLMDEPLSNLDAKLRVRTRAELRDLQQRLGITTVYVTHDQEEAMSIADRIAIMNDGEIEQVGTPEEVYEDPMSSFIADFLGDPSMNLLPTARAVSDGGEDEDLVTGLIGNAPDDATEIGIRPEDLYLVAHGETVDPDAPTTISTAYECALTVVEPIGRAYELTLRTAKNGITIVARAREVPDELRKRDSIPIAFDPEAVYAFDQEGRRLQ